MSCPFFCHHFVHLPGLFWDARMKQEATFCSPWSDAWSYAHQPVEHSCPWSRLDMAGLEGFSWQFLGADSLILVYFSIFSIHMYWIIHFFWSTIQFFGIVDSLDPYPIGTTSQSRNLIWIHQSHIHTTTVATAMCICLSSQQLGGENDLIREKARFLMIFVSIGSPLCATVFQSFSSCLMQGHPDGLGTLLGHATLGVAFRAPVGQFVECSSAQLGLNHAKTIKQPDSLG